MKLVAFVTLLFFYEPVLSQDNGLKKMLQNLRDEMLQGRYIVRGELYREDLQDNSSEIFTVNEFHDCVAGIHSLEIKPSGIHSPEINPSGIRNFYFSALAKKTFAQISPDGNCKTDDPESAAGRSVSTYLYKGSDIRNPTYFLGPSAAIERFSNDEFEKYNISTIRGIKAVGYRSKDKGLGTKYVVWFAQHTWKTNLRINSSVLFPLRVEIEGKRYLESIDFFDVQNVPDTELFRLKDSLMKPFEADHCELPSPPGLKPPTLPKVMAFIIAETNLDIGDVEYFDLINKLFRSTMNEGPPIIYDDAYGLTYTLDESCKVRPSSTIQLKPGKQQIPGVIIVAAYLGLDHKHYIGESTVRGIPVDIWEAYGTTTIEKVRFFIAKKGVIVSANSQASDGATIVRAVIKFVNDDDARVIDVFDFKSATNSFEFRKAFNIEACIHSSQFVDIEYEATKPFNIDEFKAADALSLLKEATQTAILSTTSISPLQIPYVKAEIRDAQHVQVFVKLLAPPPYLSWFAQRRSKYPHYHLPRKDAPSSEACAQRCAESAECSLMLYCPGNLACYTLRSNAVNIYTPVDKAEPTDCLAFDKSVLYNTLPKRLALDEIISALEKEIMQKKGNFNIDFSVDAAAEKLVKFRAVKFEAHLSQFNENGHSARFTTEFKSQSIKPDGNSSFLVPRDVFSLAECYQECKANSDISCSSFSLCTKSKKCVLSGLNIFAGKQHEFDSGKVLQHEAADCTVYSMNRLSEFDRYEGKVPIAGAVTQNSAQTASECAVQCRQTNVTGRNECLSFNFCPRSETCFYYDTHFNWQSDAGTSQKTEFCDHYALRYSASYQAVGKGTLSDAKAMKFEDISMEQCAKQCSEFSDNECKTFAYCDSPLPDKETKTCHMYSVHVQDSKKRSSENACTLYTKDSALNDEVIRPQHQALANYVSVGMGNSGFSFVLILMLAVGIIAGITIYNKRENLSGIFRPNAAPQNSLISNPTTISYRRSEQNSADAI